MATGGEFFAEGYSYKGKGRRLDVEVAKITICKQQYERWCNFKVKVKCTCDSEAIQILLDHWYKTFPDTPVESENVAVGKRKRTVSKSGNGVLPETITLNSEDEESVTCSGLSPSEDVQTEIDNIPLKMEVDDDVISEEPENTGIERVLTPSVMVTADSLNKEVKQEKTWTQKFCFLSNCNQRVVPRYVEIKRLNEADLGYKVVEFVMDKNPATFRETMFSTCPQMREAGGFDLFRRKSAFSLENVSEPPGGFTTSYLAEKNEINGVICYVRPLKSIVVKAIETCPKRKRNDLNFKQKLQVLELLKQGKSQSEVGRRMGCSQSVVSVIASQKNEIHSRGNNINPNRKRLRAGKAADVEVALGNWFKSIYTPGKYIPNHIIMEQAKEEARKVGNLSFEPSSGWLNRWKLRHNIPSLSKKGSKRVEAQNKPSGEEEVPQQEVEEEEVTHVDTDSASQQNNSRSQHAESLSQHDDSVSQDDDSVSQHDGTLLHNSDSNSHPIEESVMKKNEVAERATETFRSERIVMGDSSTRDNETAKHSAKIPQEFSRTFKRHDLTLKEQMRAIELLDQKLSQTKVAKQIGSSQAAVSKIASRKDEIRAQFLTSENHDRKRARTGKAPDVESALWAWYQSLQDQEPGKQITNQMLKKQAENLAVEFGMSSFTASTGWICRWKSRHNLLQPYSKKRTASQKKNSSPIENLSARTDNSPSGTPDQQTEHLQDQDDVSSEQYGENNNTNKQHLSHNEESSVLPLPTQLAEDNMAPSTLNVQDSEMNEQVRNHQISGLESVVATSEKSASATSTLNIPGSGLDNVTKAHESDTRETTLDTQLETQKLLATAFLHSLNVLAPQTSTQGSSFLPPQLSGTAQQLARNILDLCQAPNQDSPTPTNNQVKEPAESLEVPSKVTTSVQPPKPSTVVSSVQKCGANETETHMLLDSTSLNAERSSITESQHSSSTSTVALRTPSKDQANNSSINSMPSEVPEVTASSASASCSPCVNESKDSVVGTVSSVSSKVLKKQTSAANVSCNPSKSRAKLDVNSTPSSNLSEEPVTPRYSTRKRTPNEIVQKLAQEESDSDADDDSDNDPNWEAKERKKKSSSGLSNSKEETDLSSDSEELMDSDEDFVDEDEDYDEEQEDFVPSTEETYDDDFKRKIILYAERHGNAKTSHKFDISEKMVWNWRDEKDTLFSVKGSAANNVTTSGSQSQMTDEEIEIAISNFKPTQRRSFTSKFKLEVVNHAMQTNNMAAHRKYNVSEKLIRYWRKQRNDLENCKMSLRKITPSRVTWPDLEALLKSWFFEQREWGNVLSLEILRQKAIEFAEMLKIEEFQGSMSWVARFLSRNKISLRSIEKERKSKISGESNKEN